ncbi:MAG TPA: putative quinol monooxygenase [Myxococcota bacterium]|jgi:quinol monooxygenase YgiN
MSQALKLERREFLALLAAVSLGGAGDALAATADDEVITAVTFIHGIAGREDDLHAHLLSLAAPTRAEAGCLQYDLYQSPEQPSEFMRLERWRSLAALEAHKATPPLRASFAKRTREGWTTQITVWRRSPRDT